jgi:hypothetical protein
LGDADLAEKVVALTNDSSAPVRRAVVEALGAMHSGDVVPSLFERLADDDESVRNKALNVLAIITGEVLAESVPNEESTRKNFIKNIQKKWDDGELKIVPKSETTSFFNSEFDFESEEESHALPESGEGHLPTLEEALAESQKVLDMIEDDDEEVKPKRTTPPSLEEYHELERQNKELMVRLKQVEYDATSRNVNKYGKDDISSEDYEALSEEGVDIISIVRDLEKELDASFDLKESLESDLHSTQAALEEEVASRKELEAQVELLEAQADLTSQLREEVAFIKEERNLLNKKLTDTTAKMEKALTDYDSVSDQLAAAEASIKGLQRDKVDLEAQVINLKDKVRELADLTEARRTLEAKVRDLSSRLKATEIAKNTLELELTKIAEIGRGLREENEILRKNLSTTNLEFTNLKSQMQDRDDENRELVAACERLESEYASLQSKYETTAKVLEAAKKSLRDIRSAAVRTTEHFRERYYKPGERKSK